MESRSETVTRARHHSIIGLVGAALLVAGGIAAALTGDELMRVSEGLLVAGLLLTVSGYVAIHLVHRNVYGGLGKFSSLAAAVGQTIVAVAGAIVVVTGDDASTASDVLFFAGFAPLALGLIGLGIAMYRARVVPGWGAFPLPAGLVLISVLDDPGGIALGIAWAIVLYLGRVSTSSDARYGAAR